MRSLSVLVVDESEAFLAGTRHWIASRRDVSLVGTARTAALALEAAEHLSFDLVIVEAVLAGVDGFRLTRALKSRRNAPLVVIVTLHASAAAREAAFRAGADGFLAKADFSDGLDALLESWKNEGAGGVDGVTTPATPGRLESRTGRDPSGRARRDAP